MVTILVTIRKSTKLQLVDACTACQIGDDISVFDVRDTERHTSGACSVACLPRNSVYFCNTDITDLALELVRCCKI
jgi:hypothetical protein